MLIDFLTSEIPTDREFDQFITDAIAAKDVPAMAYALGIVHNSDFPEPRTRELEQALIAALGVRASS